MYPAQCQAELRLYVLELSVHLTHVQQNLIVLDHQRIAARVKFGNY